MNETRRLLEMPALKRGIKAESRLVLRRLELTPRQIDTAIASGRAHTGGSAVCELVVNGSIVAIGTLVERDGAVFFETGGKE